MDADTIMAIVGGLVLALVIEYIMARFEGRV